MKNKFLLFTLLLAFMMPWAANAQTTVTIGDPAGTGTNSYLPMYSFYNYSYTQQIYEACEIGTAGTINSVTLWLYNSGSNTLPTFDFDIYMVETTQDAFASTSDWVSVTSADIVYSGTLTVTNTTAQAYTFTLTTPFEFRGRNNLMIAFDNKTGTYKSGLTAKAFAKTGVNCSHYVYRDSAAYTPLDMSTFTGSISVNRDVIAFDMNPDPSVAMCCPVKNLVADNIEAHSARVTWEGTADHGFNVEHKKASDENWISDGGTSGHDWSWSTLDANTTYQVRVNATCAEGNSEWKVVEFTTLPSCFAPTNLTTSDVTANGVTISWTENGDATTWELDYNIIPQWEGYFIKTIEGEPTYTFNDLNPETTYYIRVKAICGDDDDSEWTENSSFTTLPTCLAPTNFKVEFEYITATTADLSWTSNSTASSFDVQYSTDAGFENPSTQHVTPGGTGYRFARIEGLTPEMTYYARVKANCEGDDESAWSDVISFEPTDKWVIGAATTTHTTLPANNYYNYSLSEQIYTAAELGEAAAIFSIDFYKANDVEMVKDLTIYIVNTNKTKFESATDWIPVTAADIYYQGTVTFADNAWTTITLDVPYAYDGTSNLAIVVDNNTGSYKSSTPFRCYTATDNQSLYQYNDNTNLNPTDAEVGTGTLTTSKNMIRLVKGEMPSCFVPTGLAVSEVTGRSAVLSWNVVGDATDWEIQVSTDAGFENPETSYTSGGPNDEGRFRANIGSLTPGTTYYIRVRANCGEGDYSDWSNELSFTTDVACPAPTNLAVSDITPFAANVAWTSTATAFNLRYREIDASQYAIVTLTADDVWGDGSGYQMLLDADATAYGTIIPQSDSDYGYISTDGVIGSGNYGDIPSSIYDQFEYKIPVNADGALNTTNMLNNRSVTILIPAGIYDWCITNPTPGDKMWISSSNGTIGGRYDDYEFEAGKAYAFYVYDDPNSGNDATDLTITNFFGTPGEWTTIENVTSPYDLAALNSETGYEVQVQAVCGGDDGSSDWTLTYFTTLSNCAAPSDLEATPSVTSATLEWEGYQNSYNVRYRKVTELDTIFFEGFEEGLPSTWTTIDSDGDGFEWYGHINTGSGNFTTHTGDGCVVSASYDSDEQAALTPDNWLITPQLDLQGTMSVWLGAQDPDYAEEHFAIYLSTTGSTIDDFTIVLVPETVATGEYVEYTADLSSYEGQQGYIAIRHFNCEDMFFLNVDDFGLYDAGGGTPWTEAQVTEATTLTIEGLEGETEYEWQVQGINRSCDGGVTPWSELATFTTLDLCTAPYNMNLDEITATTATLSWTGYQDAFNVQYRTSEVIDDIQFFDACNEQGDWTTSNLEDDSGWEVLPGYFTFYYTTEPPQYLISPELVDIELNNSTLWFQYYAFDGEVYPESFQVGFSSTDNAVESFTWGEEVTVTNNDRFEGYAVAVPNDAKYFAVKCTSYDQYALILHNFVICNTYVAPGEWVSVPNVTSPVTIEDLTPNTEYEWGVQGICGDEEYTDWVYSYFTTLEETNLTQTISLVAGANWFSTSIDITLNDLKAALVAAVSGTTITIKAKSGQTSYNPNNGRWSGTITWNVNQMYIITVAQACELTLEGDPINPAEHPITIKKGANWIGFPLNQSMTLTNAFAGFAINGDQVKSKGGTAQYNRGRWQGTTLTNLDSGKGYIYVSGEEEDRTLVFPIGAKAAKNAGMLPMHFDKTSSIKALGEIQKDATLGAQKTMLRNSTLTKKPAKTCKTCKTNKK